ncbi:hypothetical protein AERO9A_380100 [Aeromonas salmonicida]|nr:hypothetical protein AERO9A_380100 [Aeromonas salmonicida]
MGGFAPEPVRMGMGFLLDLAQQFAICLTVSAGPLRYHVPIRSGPAYSGPVRPFSGIKLWNSVISPSSALAWSAQPPPVCWRHRASPFGS